MVLHYGESRRNREITHSRVSPLLDATVQSWLRYYPQLRSTHLFYQYCNRCGDIECIITPPGSTLPALTTPGGWSPLVAAIDTIHPDGSMTATFANHTPERCDRKGFAWRLYTCHHFHCTAHGCPTAKDMDIWLDKINPKLGGGDAMFVSNMLRSVPQVRHLDVDCFLYDYTAGVPVVVIEESKNIRKADRMTRQLASYLGCVQARVITLMDESDTFHTTVRDGERTIVHKGGGGYGLIEETVRKKLQRTNWRRK